MAVQKVRKRTVNAQTEQTVVSSPALTSSSDRDVSIEPGSSSSATSTFWYPFFCVVIPVVGMAVYTNSTLHGDFVYDDKKCVTENRDVTTGDFDNDHLYRILTNDFWGTPMTDSISHKSWRPLTIISFCLNRMIFGMAPISFHVVNVILHGINTELVRRCTHRIFTSFSDPSQRSGSPTTLSSADKAAILFATALFALHPMHTEAVSNITNRAECLSLFFQLAGFILFSTSIESQPHKAGTIRIGVALLFAVFAALCKETGIIVLGLYVTYDLFRGGVLANISGVLGKHSESDNSVTTPLKTKLKAKSKTRTATRTSVSQIANTTTDNDTSHAALRLSMISRTIAVVAVLAAFMKLRLQLQIEAPVWYGNTNTAVAAETTSARFLTMSYMNWIHFALLLFPVTFCPDWRGSVPVVDSLFDPRAWAGLAFVGFLGYRAVVCLRTRNRERESLGFAFLVLAFLPASNLLFYVGFTIAERVTYAPSVGFCILAGVYCRQCFSKYFKLTTLLCVTILSLCTGVLVWRDHQWGNEQLLWEAATTTCPKNFVSHVLLGNVYEKQGNLDAALGCFRNSLEYNPAYLIAHLNVGRILRNRRMSAEAKESFISATKSCDTPHTCGIVYNAVGLTAADLREWDIAVEYHTVAVNQQPNNQGYQQHLSMAQKMLAKQPKVKKVTKKSTNTPRKETSKQRPKKKDQSVSDASTTQKNTDKDAAATNNNNNTSARPEPRSAQSPSNNHNNSSPRPKSKPAWTATHTVSKHTTNWLC
eukprot:m.144682 g.144682  ORF g.144682 m.144682 type:complete len:763 (+) comp30389_c1_seq4:47-2335(+)